MLNAARCKRKLSTMCVFEAERTIRCRLAESDSQSLGKNEENIKLWALSMQTCHLEMQLSVMCL